MKMAWRISPACTLTPGVDASKPSVHPGIITLRQSGHELLYFAVSALDINHLKFAGFALVLQLAC
jgi:hypothetical protein